MNGHITYIGNNIIIKNMMTIGFHSKTHFMGFYSHLIKMCKKSNVLFANLVINIHSISKKEDIHPTFLYGVNSTTTKSNGPALFSGMSVFIVTFPKPACLACSPVHVFNAACSGDIVLTFV